MPRFPKDKRETLSLCYQVLAEDLEVLMEFIETTGMTETDKDIFNDISCVARDARKKSKRLALQIVEERDNIISVDFIKKED